MPKTLIAVFSDSHSNTINLTAAAVKAKEMGAVKFIHLGDNYIDSFSLKKICKDVVAIPGVFCEEYKDPSIPNRIIMDINGFKILISHTPNSNNADLKSDVKPEKALENNKLDCFLYGHTHMYEAMIKGETLHLNPGHLKTDDNRNLVLSFGLLEIEKAKATGRIFDINGKLLQETVLFKL